MPLKHLLSLSALALLPLTAPAATIPIASGQICFDTDSPNPTVFPNGFVAYDALCTLFLQFGADPSSGGFNALLGQDGSLFTIETYGLNLTSFSPPDTTGPIFLEYTTDDPFIGSARLLQEFGNPDPDVRYQMVVLFGEFVSLRIEADAFPSPDADYQVNIFAHITLAVIGADDEDPLAIALLHELMNKTGGTGSLYLNTTATFKGDHVVFGATQLSTTAIPEPATIASLLATTALTLCALRRRKQERACSTACGNVTDTFPS